jgi:TFIIF-interacting CTD phosphatase-like protein
MEQQERKRRQMLNKEFKMFSEKIAEAATASVSLHLVVNLNREFSHPTNFRQVTHWNRTPHSGNSRLKVFLTAQMFASNPQQNVSYTLRILPSSSLL